jgi:hypothetical protein
MPKRMNCSEISPKQTLRRFEAWGIPTFLKAKYPLLLIKNIYNKYTKKKNNQNNYVHTLLVYQSRIPKRRKGRRRCFAVCRSFGVPGNDAKENIEQEGLEGLGLFLWIFYIVYLFDFWILVVVVFFFSCCCCFFLMVDFSSFSCIDVSDTFYLCVS